MPRKSIEPHKTDSEFYRDKLKEIIKPRVYKRVKHTLSNESNIQRLLRYHYLTKMELLEYL